MSIKADVLRGVILDYLNAQYGPMSHNGEVADGIMRAVLADEAFVLLPLMRTGRSPATVAGRDLFNRFAESLPEAYGALVGAILDVEEEATAIEHARVRKELGDTFIAAYARGRT